MDPVNIDHLTVDELKVLAYDNIAAREAADRNLHAINQRILELQSAPAPKPVHEGRVTRPARSKAK